MATRRSQFSARSIREYWAGVRGELCGRHGLTVETAETGIANFRAALEKLGVGDIQYHAPIDEIADGIINGEYAVAPAAKKPARRLRKAV